MAWRGVAWRGGEGRGEGGVHSCQLYCGHSFLVFINAVNAFRLRTSSNTKVYSLDLERLNLSHMSYMRRAAACDWLPARSHPHTHTICPRAPRLSRPRYRLSAETIPRPIGVVDVTTRLV